MKFGEKLKLFRFANDLSQDQLAQVLGNAIKRNLAENSREDYPNYWG